MEERRISVLESYSSYRDKYSREHKLYLTKKEYNKVIKSIGEELSYELITTGQGIDLPNRLGMLRIVKYLQKNKQIDYNQTKITYGKHNKDNPDNKKTVYHTNRVTRGFVPKVYWSRKKANFRNKMKFYFKMTRPNIRPNSYNKNNPKVSLIPFFKEKGFRMYSIFNPYLKNK